MPNKANLWPDSIFLGIFVCLIIGGTFIFTSASFGLLVEEGVWGNILFSQLAMGLGGGLLLGTAIMLCPLSYFRRYAFYLMLVALIINLLVFVPGIGFSAGGAARWIHVLGTSFQPSELLKLVLVVFLASWMARAKGDLESARFGLGPFLLTMTIIGGIILSQPDTGTFLIMLGTGFVMFFVAGGKLSHMGLMILCGVILLVVLMLTRPYVRSRIEVFLDPSQDPLGESYQIRQSLLAIGSGQALGRGFGQSMQKFQYLPEPIGDSIFAVIGEEFGYMGTSLVTLLFVAFCLRGLRIALLAKNSFYRLLVTGIVIMTAIQAFMHIGANIGLLPLTGIPLPFISHGGTALMFSIAGAAIVLNISRFKEGQTQK